MVHVPSHEKQVHVPPFVEKSVAYDQERAISLADRIIHTAPCAVSSQELMEVVRSETVPPTVRAAFAQLVEHCHLDVSPLLPQPSVR